MHNSELRKACGLCVPVLRLKRRIANALSSPAAPRSSLAGGAQAPGAASEDFRMAYRRIIGDAALLATIALMAAIIAGAF